METEGLFPSSKKSDIGFCFAPDQFTPRSHITVPQQSLLHHSPIYAPKSQQLSFLHIFEYNILCITYIPCVCCMSHIRFNHLFHLQAIAYMYIYIYIYIYIYTGWRKEKGNLK
jgi:hypothetical protein